MSDPLRSPARPEQLLNDLGSRLGIDNLKFSAEGLCELVFDGGLRTITLHGGGHWISAVQLEHHPLPAGDTTAELALRANFLWRATHGATLALDGERRLWAQVVVEEGNANAARLLANLETLLDLADAWRSRSREFAPAASGEQPCSVFLNRA